LKGYSPFVPLNLEDSAIPITVMNYTLTNVSAEPVTAELVGWLEKMSHSPRKVLAGEFASQPELTTLSHGCAMRVPTQTRGRKKKGHVRPSVFHNGTMTLSYLGSGAQATDGEIPGIAADLILEPGESRSFTFLISWHFPVVRIKGQYGTKTIPFKNEYMYRFEDANAVAKHVAENYETLSAQTRRWPAYSPHSSKICGPKQTLALPIFPMVSSPAARRWKAAKAAGLPSMASAARCCAPIASISPARTMPI